MDNNEENMMVTNEKFDEVSNYYKKILDKVKLKLDNLFIQKQYDVLDSLYRLLVDKKHIPQLPPIDEKKSTSTTHPNSWINKYWSKNDINEKLKEAVEPDQVDVSSIKMNDTLSPLIWDGEEMNDDESKDYDDPLLYYDYGGEYLEVFTKGRVDFHFSLNNAIDVTNIL